MSRISTSILMLAVIATSACADDVAKDKSKDASNNKGKIAGTKWSSLAANVNGLDLQAGLLTLEFKKGGGLVYVAGPQTFTGKYTLGKGDKVTLNLDQNLAGRKEHEENVTIARDRLTMTDSDGTSLTFKRVMTTTKPAEPPRDNPTDAPKNPPKDKPKNAKSDNKGKIEGTKWSSIAATVRGQKIPAGVLTLEFKKDGGLVYGTPLGDFKGTYSLGKGSDVTLKLDRELAGRKEHTEKVSITRDRLKMTDSDGTSISFKRVMATPKSNESPRGEKKDTSDGS